jgi:predicted DNA binding CopG/RHH family protein
VAKRIAETKEPGPGRFGPKPYHVDAFDGLSDEELESELNRMLQKDGSVTISMRMPSRLLERTKRIAESGGVPYQTLIKRLVEAGLNRMERAGSRGT